MSTQETPTGQLSPGAQRGRGGLGVLEAERLGPTRRRPPPHAVGWAPQPPSVLGVLLLDTALLAALLALRTSKPRRPGVVDGVTGEEGEHPSTPTEPGT